MADQPSPKLPTCRYTLGRRMASAIAMNEGFSHCGTLSTRKGDTDQPSMEIISRNFHIPSGHNNRRYNYCSWSLLHNSRLLSHTLLSITISMAATKTQHHQSSQNIVHSNYGYQQHQLPQQTLQPTRILDHKANYNQKIS